MDKITVYIEDFSNNNIIVDKDILMNIFSTVHEIGTKNRPMPEIEFCSVKPATVAEVANYKKNVEQTISVLEEFLKNER